MVDTETHPFGALGGLGSIFIGFQLIFGPLADRNLVRPFKALLSSVAVAVAVAVLIRLRYLLNGLSRCITHLCCRAPQK